MPPQRDARGLAQAAASRLLLLPPGRVTRRGPVGRGGGPQPVPPLGGQARIPDPVPVIVHARPGPVLAGQHRHDVHMVVGVPDRDPAHRVVFLAVPGQPGPVHHLMRDLRPLIID